MHCTTVVVVALPMRADKAVQRFPTNRRPSRRRMDKRVSLLCMCLGVYEREGDRKDSGKRGKNITWPIPYRPLIVVQKKNGPLYQK